MARDTSQPSQPENRDMRIVLTVIVALAAASLVSGNARATPLKPEQVRTVCGKKLEENSKAMGCERECGTKRCAYSCKKDSKGNGKDCFGSVLARTGTAKKPSSTGAGVAR
jgi:hypothetical protein